MSKFSRVIAVHSPKSTRATKYNSEVRPQLVNFAKQHNAEFAEIAPVNLPYFDTRNLIENNLADGDLVVAAGGDGIANVTLDAAMLSGKDIVLAVVPLGNVNDFSAVANGRVKDPAKILGFKEAKFHPLELKINDERPLYSAQYISFGATTVLVDWLNSPKIRAARKKYHGNVARLMMLGASSMGTISKNIAKLKIPPFRLKGATVNKNSFGFFLGRTGKFFRPQNGQKFHKNPSEFWFHSDNFCGKTVRDSAKLTNWLLRGIPGKISKYEEIEFAEPIDLTCQIGGDNVPLKAVSKINCKRSEKTVRILSNELKL